MTQNGNSAQEGIKASEDHTSHPFRQMIDASLRVKYGVQNSTSTFTEKEWRSVVIDQSVTPTQIKGHNNWLYY